MKVKLNQIEKNIYNLHIMRNSFGFSFLHIYDDNIYVYNDMKDFYDLVIDTDIDRSIDGIIVNFDINEFTEKYFEKNLVFKGKIHKYPHNNKLFVTDGDRAVFYLEINEIENTNILLYLHSNHLLTSSFSYIKNSDIVLLNNFIRDKYNIDISFVKDSSILIKISSSKESHIWLNRIENSVINLHVVIEKSFLDFDLIKGCSINTKINLKNSNIKYSGVKNEKEIFMRKTIYNKHKILKSFV